MTPLHLAAREGNAEHVRSLLQEGADVHALDDLGRTALYYAASKRSAETVLVLLAWGCDPNTADEGGVTPLMAAIGRHLGSGLGGDFLADTPKDELDTLGAILLGRPNFNQRDCAGRTAIHYAAYKLNWEAFELLMFAGCDLTLRDEEGTGVSEYAQWWVEDYDEATVKVNERIATAVERARG